MAKNRKLTNREKRMRAETKKRLQEQGILPPDKPRLNRMKFVEKVRKEWNNRDGDCFVWSLYLQEAVGCMLCKTEGFSGRLSAEAVGAAKVLKIAMRLHEFYEGVRERGEHEYRVADKYNYIKDILDA